MQTSYGNRKGGNRFAIAIQRLKLVGEIPGFKGTRTPSGRQAKGHGGVFQPRGVREIGGVECPRSRGSPRGGSSGAEGVAWCIQSRTGVHASVADEGAVERARGSSSLVLVLGHSLARSLVPLRRVTHCGARCRSAAPVGALAPMRRSRWWGGVRVPRDPAGQSGARIAGVRHMAARRLREPQSQYVAVSRSGNTSERVVARACLRKERSR